jgi:hypothetical protein
MNVTLSIQAEFEDIPKEIAHLLEPVKQELADTSTLVTNLAEDMQTPPPSQDEETLVQKGTANMEALHNLRLKMAKIDTRMEDVMSILGGYLHYVENPPQEPQKEALEQEEQDEEG